MFRKIYLILQLKWAKRRKEHPSFPEASQLLQLPEGRDYLGLSPFQGKEEVRKPYSYLEAYHSCPDAPAKGKVCVGAWDIPALDSRNLHCSKSVLYLREGPSPTFGRQCSQMKRYPQETTTSATYMVVELLDRFWCHQSHFHPYPHTNNIHCWHGTEWAGNSHAHHTGEWSDQLLYPSGRKHLHCQELLRVHAGIWFFLRLGKKKTQQNKTNPSEHFCFS